MAKGKDIRIIVILECTCCVRKGVNKESTGISRYITQKESTQYTQSIRIEKFCRYCQKYTIHGEIKK